MSIEHVNNGMGKEDVLQGLRQRHFLAPNGENVEHLLQLVRHALLSVISKEGNGPVYPDPKRKDIHEILEESVIPEKASEDPFQILSTLPDHMQGSVKANNPYMVKNIIPVPALMHLVSNLVVSTYMPNAVTGEDAAETLNAEIACAAAIAKLAGYDHEKSGGLFTFGGTATNLYGFKMGLYKALPTHGLKGINGTKVAIIGSQPAHYSHQTGANWIGIGQDNYIQVRSNIDQTTRLDELESVCRKTIEAGKRIACIEAVGGTTSNMAIDDFESIYTMREGLVKDYQLDYSPHLHADAVLGWAYLNFLDYDIDQNKLGFTEPVLMKIKKVTERLRTLKYVDSFGVDFHKTGYMPYVSSMVMVKNKEDLGRLRRDGKIMTPLFHEHETYNPGTFSLETSRSAANILATWLTLQSIGKEGYQSLLGHSFEMSERMREKIRQHESSGMYAVNQEPYGCDIFVRCYPEGTDTSGTHARELTDDQLLRQNNDYTSKFAKWLFANKVKGDTGIGLSKSSAAFYTDTGSPVVALRIYPLNPYITAESADILIDRLAEAKHEFNLS